jgi:hypothetical protein
MEQPKSNASETPSNQRSVWKKLQQNPSPLLTLELIIVVVFIFGMFLGRVSNQNRAHQFNNYRFGGQSFNSTGRRTGFGMFGGQNSQNQDRIQGVVTNVSGSTLTVAGDGTTNAVQINSSTQYSGGNSAAVDDTVIVSGTTSNGAFTASKIDINP